MTDGLFSIPAACVKQIGGLAKTDAPVRVRRPGVTYTWSWASGDQHTDGSRPGAGDRLLLPQSAPALLQVLARHVGLTLEVGEVPRIRWYRYSDIPSCWKLEVEARSMSIRPFGEYGGGWGDDCEMWRWWVPVLIGFHDPKIVAAQREFSEALLSQPHIRQGYTNRMTDATPCHAVRVEM